MYITEITTDDDISINNSFVTSFVTSSLTTHFSHHLMYITEITTNDDISMTLNSSEIRLEWLVQKDVLNLKPLIMTH